MCCWEVEIRAVDPDYPEEGIQDVWGFKASHRPESGRAEFCGDPSTIDFKTARLRAHAWALGFASDHPDHAKKLRLVETSCSGTHRFFAPFEYCPSCLRAGLEVGDLRELSCDRCGWSELPDLEPEPARVHLLRRVPHPEREWVIW